MAKFIKGDVVVVPFPFSDLTHTKRRPALVIASLSGDDLILCQITSQKLSDIYAISINDNDFILGGLNQKSNVRPNKLFTADSKIILYKIGQLNPAKIGEITEQIISILEK